MVVRSMKRVLVAVVGFAVLAGGIAMIILPGPAVVVIPLGLGILSTEFSWARGLLRAVKTKLQNGKRRYMQ
ncbi:MAG: PGPGW domain-containing protein [Nitrospirota bacterium]